MGDTPVRTSKVQPCQGHEMTALSSRYPSPSGPPWCGQVLSIACRRPSTLKIATMCSLTCTTLLEPGGRSSARPQRALIAMAFPSADQVLLDVGAAVRRPRRRAEPVRHLGDGALDRRALLGVGQGLEADGQTRAARRAQASSLLMKRSTSCACSRTFTLGNTPRIVPLLSMTKVVRWIPRNSRPRKLLVPKTP